MKRTGPVHQFKKPPSVERRDNTAAFREIRERGKQFAAVILNAASQFIERTPISLLDNDPELTETRYAIWHRFAKLGVSVKDIARWWGLNEKAVHNGIAKHRHEEELATLTYQDETRPRMVPGRGEKHEDCVRYAECVNTFAKKSNVHARCPLQCSGYVQIKRRATDYLKQLDAPTVCAQATSKGAGI